MRKLLMPTVLAALLFAYSCNQKAVNQSDTKSKDSAKTDNKSVNIKLAELATTKDMACGMPLEEGSVADTASFLGKTYGFCSAECKAEFEKNPQSFMDKK